MSTFAEYAISAMLIIGGVFTLIGAIGLARLPDFYTRLHGPTKATTVGVGAIVISSVIYFSTLGRGIGIEEILITAFLFMTRPSVPTSWQRPPCTWKSEPLRKLAVRPGINKPFSFKGSVSLLFKTIV